ncbi:MAG: hypothetical protein K2M19_07165 [Muribaculaceae bacterium]|nr:hypothetical protein [Muribaculaceae bacterium]
MGIGEWYKRLRHSRGFGVHSPFAYRMVREVLAAPRGCAYYAESALDRRDLRRLYRILVELHPCEVIIYAPSEREKILRAVVLEALPRGGAGAPLVVIDGFDAEPSIPAGASVLTDAPAAPALERHVATTPFGHLYRNPRRALFVALQHLPSQIFEVRF